MNSDMSYMPKLDTEMLPPARVIDARSSGCVRRISRLPVSLTLSPKQRCSRLRVSLTLSPLHEAFITQRCSRLHVSLILARQAA